MTPTPPTPNPEHPTPSSPTVVALLTPPGQGGIAILHVAGPRAFELVAQVFRPRSGATVEPDASRLHYGHIVENAEVVDEVLVRLVPGREPLVEVNCHGGQVAVQRVADCLTKRGAVAVTSEAFVERQARSAIEAEAANALQHAATPLGVEVLLDQLNGALERALRSLPPDRPAEALRALLATERFGRALWQPPTVALVGPVNAGKSSLFNALAREDRMIVSPSPGTTRDAVSALVALGGLPVLLTDTAGQREPGSVIEEEAIARARAAAAAADLALLVLDGSGPRPEAGIPDSRCQIPDSRFQNTKHGTPSSPVPIPHCAFRTPHSLVVLNKSDLGLAPWAREVADAVAVSATRGDGLEELSRRIVERLVGEARYEPGRAVAFTERQAELLAEALEAATCEEARRCIEAAIYGPACSEATRPS